MRFLFCIFALILSLCVAQEFAMGTVEQPKADLPADDQLIIQNTVSYESHCYQLVRSRRMLSKGR